MEARVRLLGHSVHQSFVFFPLGLLAAAVGCDVVFLASHDQTWSLMAFRLMAAGVATGLLAAVVGFIDWRSIPAGTRAKKVGQLHGVGNVLVLFLFIVSWLLRKDVDANVPSMLALALSFAGFAIVGITGWMGGELVSRLGVGVADDANLNAPSSLTADRPIARPVLDIGARAGRS